ncbi:hypothetical protein E4U41_005192 [Claviceps citrina]|nr:hypothetical protein E4U41_005192 [Claviceps citrina]
MSRLASPAIGCHLRFVEVQVGNKVERHDATTFEQPLEFSLQGQRSLGSEVGTLLLIISTGSRQMLSLRLNDIFNHPCGTEETITVDKQTHKVCVRLPNLDHTLRICFQHGRDFLVSVCILRKTGFTIEETPSSALQSTHTRLNRNSDSDEPTQPVGTPRPSTCTMRTGTNQSSISHVRCSNSTEDATTPHGNIFDEVLDRLNQTGKKPDAVSSKDSSMSARPEDSNDVWPLSPSRGSAAKRKMIADQRNADSSLQSRSSHGKAESRVTGEVSDQPKQSAAEDAPPPRRHHGYFTRSFSLAARRLGTNLDREERSRCARQRADGKRSTTSKCLRSSTDKVSNSFDSSPTVDFRNLLPHRRSLPFLETKHHARKRLKISDNSASSAPKTPVNASSRTDMQALSGRTVCRIPEILTLLMRVSTLDELEMKSSTLYKQYEQDVADSHEDGERAAFYLDSLEKMRTRFWLDKLLKVSGAEHEAWAEW